MQSLENVEASKAETWETLKKRVVIKWGKISLLHRFGFCLWPFSLLSDVGPWVSNLSNKQIYLRNQFSKRFSTSASSNFLSMQTKLDTLKFETRKKKEMMSFYWYDSSYSSHLPCVSFPVSQTWKLFSRRIFFSLLSYLVWDRKKEISEMKGECISI